MAVAGKEHGDNDNCSIDESYNIPVDQAVIYKPGIVEYGVVDYLHGKPVVMEEEWQVEGAAEDEPEGTNGVKEPLLKRRGLQARHGERGHNKPYEMRKGEVERGKKMDFFAVAFFYAEPNAPLNSLL